MSEAPPSDFAYERLSVNSLLAGRYQLVQYIGEGASGSVYLARDLALDNREVAVKVLHPTLANHAAALERLRREVEISQGLTHPGVVQVYTFDLVEVGEDGRPTAMLVMEYVEGSTLRNLIDQGALREDEALALFNQLVDVLAFIHERGIVHRDIKPENIIVTATGGVKLTDFGLAKRDIAMDLLTHSGQVMGTPGYMAPELYRGAAATPASDLYSLGLILYEMLYGERLQRSEQMLMGGVTREESRIKRKLRWLTGRSGAILLILNECCAPDAAARPDSAVTLKRQLAETHRFSRRALRYDLRRHATRWGRSALRVMLPIACVLGLAGFYFGRVVPPYSVEHLFTATQLDRLQFGANGGLLGIAPLDGTEYIRARASYGHVNLGTAPTLGVEGRRAMLMCGIEHRLPEFRGTLPPDFRDVGVALTESCAAYPLTERPRIAPPLVSPLAVVARIGDEELFEDMLATVPNERVSEEELAQTYLSAARMNRTGLIRKLIERGLVLKQIRDDLLIEVLMNPSDQCFELIRATGVPFTLTPHYIANRVNAASNPNRARWRTDLSSRQDAVAHRIARMGDQGAALRAVGDALSPLERGRIAAQHHDLVVILTALGIDWKVTSDSAGMTPLLFAMLDRTNPAVELLIAQPKIDLQSANAIGMTPLAFAVGTRKPAWIRALAMRGVDMNTKIKLREEHRPASPLQLLVPGNFVGLLRAVLKAPGVELNGEISEEERALAASTRIKSSKMMELLLDHGAAVGKSNRSGFAAIHGAASHGTLRHVQLLLTRGAEVNLRTGDGETPLAFAVRRGDGAPRAAVIRTLVEAGADPLARSNIGQTVFEAALRFKHSDAIGALLDATGYDPRTPLPNGKLLIEFANENPRGVIEILRRERAPELMELFNYHTRLALGCIIALPAPRKELPSLDTAVKARDFHAVQILLAKGADPMTGDAVASALAHSIIRRDHEITELLLAHRPIEVNRVQPNQIIPLRAAAQLGEAALVEQLLSLGADPEQLDEYGNPPLLAAYGSGNRTVVELLRNAAPKIELSLNGQILSRRELETIYEVSE